MSDAWLQDRAAMLALVMQGNTQDSTIAEFNLLGSNYYEDITTGIKIDPYIASQRIIFGGDSADTLAGNDLKDRLYGGLGNDTLNGGGGDDYLEGGIGDDVLDGGARLMDWNGARCAVLFEREKHEAANDAERRMAT